MANGNLNWIANFIWGIADDVLRDLYVRGKYRDVILPMVVLRRLSELRLDRHLIERCRVFQSPPVGRALGEPKPPLTPNHAAQFRDEIKRHREDGALVAAQRADEMLAKGDVDGLVAALGHSLTQSRHSVCTRDRPLWLEAAVPDLTERLKPVRHKCRRPCGRAAASWTHGDANYSPSPPCTYWPELGGTSPPVFGLSEGAAARSRSLSVPCFAG